MTDQNQNETPTAGERFYVEWSCDQWVVFDGKTSKAIAGYENEAAAIDDSHRRNREDLEEAQAPDVWDADLEDETTSKPVDLFDAAVSEARESGRYQIFSRTIKGEARFYIVRPDGDREPADVVTAVSNMTDARLLVNELNRQAAKLETTQATLETAEASLENLDAHRDEAERKAWDSLARYKFQMFGYWSAIWVHLNRLCEVKKPSPFADLVGRARVSIDSWQAAGGGDLEAGQKVIAQDKVRLSPDRTVLTFVPKGAASTQVQTERIPTGRIQVALASLDADGEAMDPVAFERYLEEIMSDPEKVATVHPPSVQKDVAFDLLDEAGLLEEWYTQDPETALWLPDHDERLPQNQEVDRYDS